VVPIYLGRQLPAGSSDLPGEEASHFMFPLFGLAPDGVYLAGRVASTTGELLPHRFTLTSGRTPRRSAFCCTCRRIAPPGRYPASCSVEPGLSSAPRGRSGYPDCFSPDSSNLSFVFSTD